MKNLKQILMEISEELRQLTEGIEVTAEPAQQEPAAQQTGFGRQGFGQKTGFGQRPSGMPCV